MIRHSLRRRGSWYFVDFRWNGQRYRVPLKTSRKSDAEELAIKVVRDIVQESAPAEITLGEMVVRWLNVAQTEKRSWKTDQLFSRAVLAYFGFDRPLSGIRTADVLAFKIELSARQTRRGSVMTKATVNRHLAYLKTLFNRATDWDLYELPNPVKKVKLYSESPKHQYFSHEQIRQLLAAAREVQLDAKNEIQQYFLPIMAVAVFTGMRLGEVLSLRWDDIQDGLITIRAETAKSKKSRQVPLSLILAEILKTIPKMKKLSIETKIVDPRKPPRNTEGMVFPVRSKPDVIKNVWRMVKALAGVNPQARFHDLRHTFASLLVQGGADLATVRELLGHSDIKMTAIYSHSSRMKKNEAVQGLKFD